MSEQGPDSGPAQLYLVSAFALRAARQMRFLTSRNGIIAVTHEPGHSMLPAASSLRIFAGAAVAAAALLGSPAAQAGGCIGASCYQLVTPPPVYKSVVKVHRAHPVKVRTARVHVHKTHHVVKRRPLKAGYGIGQRRHEVVPAQYEYVTEQVMVEPERRIAQTRPAVIGTVTDYVMIAPATRRWEVTRGANGETIGCWVDVPAQYGYQSRTVEMVAASVDYIMIPAVYEERQRKVMVRPTYVQREERPFGYGHRQVQASPGSQYWAPIN